MGIGETTLRTACGHPVTYVSYHPKRVLNVHRHVDGGWLWTKYSAHPYVGCQEGCVYCYWRDEKYNMLARDPAAKHLSDPFSQYIKVKTNAPELLRKELSSVQQDVIAVGDYQPAEGRYGLSREMLKVCADLGFPTLILEKSPLVLKDLDVISKIKQRAWACVTFSIVRGDSYGYGEIFEPYAPRIEGRFRAMRKIAEAGILTGTAFMPILPYVCDDDSNLETVVKKTAENGGKFVLAAGLTMSGAQATYFLKASKRHDVELAEKYRELYRGAYSPTDAEHTGRIGLKVRDFCAKYGIRDRMPRYVADDSFAMNKRVAEDVFNKCYEMELECAPSYRTWAYRRAGWTVDELDRDILTLYKKQGIKGLEALPSVGPSLAAFIAGRLDKM
jgi:DNA repair photolyase